MPCTAIADDAERLACYDRALRAPQGPAAPTPAAAASAPSAASTPPAATAPAAAPATAPAAAAAAPAAQRAEADAIVSIVVVGVRTVPGRETTFTAQDGTIWVQTDSQRIAALPATPFDAEIRPGAMGSTFLRPIDQGRAVRVRRASP